MGESIAAPKHADRATKVVLGVVIKPSIVARTQSNWGDGRTNLKLTAPSCQHVSTIDVAAFHSAREQDSVTNPGDVKKREYLLQSCPTRIWAISRPAPTGLKGIIDVTSCFDFASAGTSSPEASNANPNFTVNGLRLVHFAHHQNLSRKGLVSRTTLLSCAF